jgi:hypothetical protein
MFLTSLVYRLLLSKYHLTREQRELESKIASMQALQAERSGDRQ